MAVLSGCAKEIDFDLTDDLRLYPGGRLPLLKGTLELVDLTFEGDSVLLVDPDQALRIYFRQDSLVLLDANQLLEIPDQDPGELNLSKDEDLVQLGASFQTLAAGELDSIAFYRGTLVLDLKANQVFARPIDLRFTLFNGIDNQGQTFVREVTLPAGDTVIRSERAIDGLFVDMTQGGSGFNYLNIQAEILNSADLPNGGKVDMSYRFLDLEVDRAFGFFGQRAERIPDQEADFRIPGLEDFSNGFFLTNPQVNFIVRNSAGLPVELNHQLQGVNANNEVVPLDPPVLEIQAAQQVGQLLEQVYAINRTNSNVVDFLGSIPQQLFYTGLAELNPQGVTRANFIERDSELQVDMEIDLPLEFRLEQMRLDETIDGVDFDPEGTEEIQSLSLIVFAQNRIPLELNLEVSFLNSVGDSLTGFKLFALESAPIDQNGRAVGYTNNEKQVVFNDTQIELLKLTDQVRLRGSVSTPQQGAQSVKLYADDHLQVQFVAEVKAVVNANEL